MTLPKRRSLRALIAGAALATTLAGAAHAQGV